MNTISSFLTELNNRGLWEKEITISRGQYLTVKGNRENFLYLVVSGTLQVYIDDGVDQHIVRLAYAQDFVTALDSFLSGKPTGFYIEAIKTSTLKLISKKAILAFVHSSNEHLLGWNAILQEGLLQSLEREKDLLIASPQERYQRVLARSPRLFQEVPLKYIASYLRMSPETLSRIKKS